MKAVNYLKKYVHVIFAFALLLIALAINQELTKPPIVITKQDDALNLNDEMLQKFNLGLKRLLSSFLWVSTILESDIDHYKKKDLNSWMFLRFNSISILEPKFYENYVFGGMYLSIIKDDIGGAGIIYQKGVSAYPNDYYLLKNAAFHFYFEAKDLEKSYNLFNRLQVFKGTSFTKITLSRLEAKNGNLEKAFFLLNEHQKNYPPSSMVGKKIFDYRYSVKAEIDLDCLNNNHKNCSLYDLENNSYLKINNLFKASKAWMPYRPKWKD
jgi:hypothetical protein